MVLCAICRKEINKDKDGWSNIKDYHARKLYQEETYHTKCFTDRITGGVDGDAVLKKAYNILNSLGKQVGVEDKEVVII